MERVVIAVGGAHAVGELAVAAVHIAVLRTRYARGRAYLVEGELGLTAAGCSDCQSTLVSSTIGMAKRGASTTTETLEVEVQADHLEGLAKCRPSSAVAELIWNALDADAEEVSVSFQRNLLGGVESIEISDDGHGVGGEGEDPNELFRRLGGSWKRRERRTRAGRAVHGQAGEGRFKAFALGDTVTWTTQRVEGGELAAFTITKPRNSRQFTRSTLKSTTMLRTGTTVRIDHVHATPAPDSEIVFRALCEEFAIYLRQYPNITIKFDRHPLCQRD